MPSENSSPGYEATHTELKKFSSWIFMLIIFILSASVSSVPFPFVRQIWLKETFGLTGLINALVFGWISLGLKRMQLPPIIAGIGICLNEQIMAVSGFIEFSHNRSPRPGDLLFLAAVLIGALFIELMLLRAGKTLADYKKRFYADRAALDPNEDDAAFLFLTFNFIVYGLLFGGFYFSRFVDWPWNVAVLKTLALGASFIAFLGIGYEIHFCIRRKENILQGWIKGLSHLIVLATLWLLVYDRMPFGVMLSLY